MKKVLYRPMIVMLFGMLVSLCMPLFTQAATLPVGPACALLATVDGSTALVHSGATILVRSGAPLTIGWIGTGATTASNQNGTALPLTGTFQTTISSRHHYEFRFAAGSVEKKCNVTILPATGSITTIPTAVSGKTTVISGKATGVNSVVLSIIPSNVTNVTPSNAVPVVRGAWSYTVPTLLPAGQYRVEAATTRANVRTILAATTFAITGSVVTPVTPVVTPVVPVPTASTTVVVVPVPLLIGGVAHPGATIAVAYLQMINIGTATTTVTSISLTQSGTAPVASIVGLTAITDDGAAKGTVGDMLAKTPFVGTVATVPITIVLAPHEMRLVTVKAITALNITPYLGTKLTLLVSGIGTIAHIQSTLPLFGTTWTFGF